MRKRLISKTYLRDVNKYKLNINFDNNDNYIAIKKIIDIKEPFYISKEQCIINNGYYIVEVIPKKEHYAMRVFFNERKERLEYYFDISLENGIDEETKIPYYNDLYTDIVVKDEKIEILDEDELIEAFDKNKISKEDFILANYTTNLLLDSIKTKNNKYMNLDLESYLQL